MFHVSNQLIPMFQETNVLRLRDTLPVIDDSDSDFDESHNTSVAALVADGQASQHWEGSLDAHLVKRIGQATGCIISQKLDTMGLLVRGKNATDTEKAVEKLQTVASMMVSLSLMAGSRQALTCP